MEIFKVIRDSVYIKNILYYIHKIEIILINFREYLT